MVLHGLSGKILLGLDFGAYPVDAARLPPPSAFTSRVFGYRRRCCAHAHCTAFVGAGLASDADAAALPCGCCLRQENVFLNDYRIFQATIVPAQRRCLGYFKVRRQIASRGAEGQQRVFKSERVFCRVLYLLFIGQRPIITCHFVGSGSE
ncbi:hypothetical protein D3C77_585950 [compost metagenome]